MQTQTDVEKSWSETFLKAKMAYPSEYVIRILKGNYPDLNLNKNDFKGRKFLDLGCGEGRNLVVAHEVGFDICGVEITDEIVELIKRNLSSFRIDNSNIRKGTNSRIPFNDEDIDYLLSWNSAYYMESPEADFQDHVKEFARVLKKGGHLLMSVPKSTCFIYKDSLELRPGYRIIRNDPFKVRNGAVLRMFSSADELRASLGDFFYDFRFADIHDNCFGFNYHWHIAVCRKK